MYAEVSPTNDAGAGILNKWAGSVLDDYDYTSKSGTKNLVFGNTVRIADDYYTALYEVPKLSGAPMIVSLPAGAFVRLADDFDGDGTPGALYLYLGAANPAIDLGAENFATGALWVEVGGTYRWMGTAESRNLGTEDYTDFEHWKRLTATNLITDSLSYALLSEVGVLLKKEGLTGGSDSYYGLIDHNDVRTIVEAFIRNATVTAGTDVSVVATDAAPHLGVRGQLRRAVGRHRRRDRDERRPLERERVDRGQHRDRRRRRAGRRTAPRADRRDRDQPHRGLGREEPRRRVQLDRLDPGQHLLQRRGHAHVRLRLLLRLDEQRPSGDARERRPGARRQRLPCRRRVHVQGRGADGLRRPLAAVPGLRQPAALGERHRHRQRRLRLHEHADAGDARGRQARQDPGRHERPDLQVRRADADRAREPDTGHRPGLHRHRPVGQLHPGVRRAAPVARAGARDRLADRRRRRHHGGRELGRAAQRDRRQRQRRRGRARPALPGRADDDEDARTRRARRRRKVEGYGASGAAGGIVLAQNKVSSFARAAIVFTGATQGIVTATGDVTVSAQDTAGVDSHSSVVQDVATSNDLTGFIPIVESLFPGDYSYTTASGTQTLSAGDRVRLGTLYGGGGDGGAVYEYLGLGLPTYVASNTGPDTQTVAPNETVQLPANWLGLGQPGARYKFVGTVAQGTGLHLRETNYFDTSLWELVTNSVNLSTTNYSTGPWTKLVGGAGEPREPLSRDRQLHELRRTGDRGPDRAQRRAQRRRRADRERERHSRVGDRHRARGRDAPRRSDDDRQRVRWQLLRHRHA